MDLPYDEEPQLVEKAVGSERIGNTFENENIVGHRRSPTPKADWGLADEEKGPSKTTQTGETNEAIPPPVENRENVDAAQYWAREP